MYIQILRVDNFRNYLTQTLEPKNGLNVLVGKNAQGKSALLEAIYFLSTSKSNRTTKDQDLINIHQDYLRVETEVSKALHNDFSVEIAMDRRGQKVVKIDGVKQSRVVDLLGNLNVVIFCSQDIEMIRGEPSHRRRFMNLDISQSSPSYAFTLAKYKKVLSQRNELLKKIRNDEASKHELSIWNTQLAAFGAAIISRRQNFLEILSKHAVELYSNLADTAEEMKIIYAPNPPVSQVQSEKEISEIIMQKLHSRTELDIIRGTTSCGPQRDDFTIEIDNLGARDFASQGQQRSAAIALKLAQMRVFEEETGESPVVLLDDVLAELDTDRRYALTSLLCGKCQTFITSTNTEEIPQEILEQSAVYEVVAGNVSEKS